MPPLLKFLIQRLFFAIVSFFVITALLYAGIMLTPPETRATLYLPKNLSSRMTEGQYQRLIDRIIERLHLDAPYPVQYAIWLNGVARGNWGYSPTLQENVLDSLLRRTPATFELTFFSAIFFVPLGIFSGVASARKVNEKRDTLLQASAFVAASMPTFILGLILLSIFYAGLQWFPPERLGLTMRFVVKDPSFVAYTGLYTVDGLLNGLPDLTLDALRHLVLPAATLSLFHWATMHRITRAAMLDELSSEYMLAARARGIPETKVVWRHGLRNALSPVLTSTTLSAASLLTSIYVVEIIYNFQGVSEVIARGARTVIDAPAAVGFAIYSILIVLVLMLLLDFIQALLDPRYRSGVIE